MYDEKHMLRLPFKTEKTTAYVYLLIVALYLLLSSAHLTNVLVNLTVGNSVGPYFEFISPAIDRSVVYALNLVVLFCIAVKPRKALLPLLLALCMAASYFLHMQTIDLLLTLVTYFSLTWFLTGPESFTTVRRKEALFLLVVYLFSILIIIEASTLVCWLAFSMMPTLAFEGGCKSLVDLETKAFLLTGGFAPFLIILLFFMWTAKPFFSHIGLLRKMRGILSDLGNGSCSGICTKLSPSFLVACALVLSILVAAYPHLPGVNPNAHAVGVREDIQFYSQWLTKMANQDFVSVVADSFFRNSGRTLSLLVLYLAKYTGGASSLDTVQLLPIILAPVLVLAVYFFIREANKSGCIGSLGALMSVSSFHILVGIYACFLSNWIALVELYLFMGFYLGALRRQSYWRGAAALFFSVSLLFTHSWTWGMTIGVLVIHLLLTAVFKRKKLSQHRLEILIIVVLIIANGLASQARNYALGLSASDLETWGIAQKDVSVGALGSFWDDLLYTVMHTMYGSFVNPLGLALAAIGAFVIVGDDRPASRYLLSWLVASCIFFVFSTGWVVKGRILFNFPLPFLEVAGLIGICSFLDRQLDHDRAALMKALTIVLTLLVSLVYAFRFLFSIAQI